MNFILNLFILIFLHCLADFALQSESMAKGKNPNYTPEVPPGQTPAIVWQYWLIAHAFIQGGLIIIFFPKFWYLGILETVLHFMFDYAKCNNATNPHEDQFLHILLRIIYTMIITFR